MESKISFVVVSCDGYNDLWDGFFKCFFKYWEECNLKIYLITNNLDYVEKKVTTIKVGDDINYAQNLLNALKKIDSEWILLWLDDCFFSQKIQSEKLYNLLEQAINTPNLGYLKLANHYPLSYDMDDHANFGKLPKGIKYRAAIGMSLYKKSVLEKLLIPGLNAWELDKSSYSDRFSEDFYSLTVKFSRKPIIPYVNTVIKGKWYLPAIRFLRNEGLKEILTHRKKQSIFAFIYIQLFLFYSLLLRFFRIYWKNKNE